MGYQVIGIPFFDKTPLSYYSSNFPSTLDFILKNLVRKDEKNTYLRFFMLFIFCL